MACGARRCEAMLGVPINSCLIHDFLFYFIAFIKTAYQTEFNAFAIHSGSIAACFFYLFTLNARDI